jgi:diguanylate cyclase (GGDEF)-like protein
MKHEDLVIELAVSDPEDAYIGSIEYSMQRLARELSFDLFEAASTEGVIIYSVSAPNARGGLVDFTLPDRGFRMLGVQTELVRTPEGFAITVVMPAMLGKVTSGYFMVGTLLDNNFISNIARITNAELTLSHNSMILGTSLSDISRDQLDMNDMNRSAERGVLIRRHRTDSNVAVTYGPIIILDKQMSLVTESDSSKLVALNDEVNSSHMMVFGTSVLVALILSSILALKLVSPLNRLKRKTDRTLREITGQEISHASGDEIQSLVESFDYMVDNIKHHLVERKEMEESLRMAKQDWEHTFNSITDMVTIHDLDFNIIASNKAAEQILDIDFLKDTKCYKTYHGTNAPPSSCPSCESLETRKACTHEVYEPHLGMYLEIRAIPRTNTDGEITGLIHVVRDISKRKEMEDELTKQALYDSLTELPNRALFTDRLKNLFAHKGRKQEMLFAVLFIDLDHFKRINDTLGHVFGDKLLQAVAERLKSCVRPGDTVSRFGGDEFVIILDSLVSRDEAVVISERIQHRLQSPVIISGTEIFVTLSMGIAFSSPEYEHPEHILRDADNAMYHAKLRGRAQYAVFDEEMRYSTMKTMTLENDLRRAVERKEFILHYQPVINLTSGKVSGFEALVRWNHPSEGMIYPEIFIKSAEETGTIIPLGNWVLTNACMQIARWREEFPSGEELTMSVNISGRQFGTNLPDKVEQALKAAGIPPECLKIEVTETVLMDNSKLAKDVIEKLKEMGVHVYLDDFGTGYSSLRYIHTFPVKALKIDRSFVRNIAEDREAREIVRAIAGLAANLDMTMIVEGVENEAQLEIFRNLECQYAQGYLFSKPLSAIDIETYMKDQHTYNKV